MSDDQQSRAASLQELLIAADGHWRAGELQLAARTCRSILQRKSDHADALHLLGLVCHHQKRYEDAVRFLRRSIDADSGNPSTHSNLGNLLQATGHPEDAVAAYRVALDLDDTDVNVWNNLAATLAELGRTDEAGDALQRAAELAPSVPELQVNLGNLLGEQGDYAGAIAAYQRAMALNPGLVAAQYNLGMLYADVGRLDEAAGMYRQALERDPHNAEVSNNLGTTLINLGQTEEAVELLTATIRRHPSHARAHYNLGFGLSRLGNVEDAISAYRRAIDCEPRYARARESLSRLLFRTGDTAQAVAELRTWLQVEPDNPIARHLLAAWTDSAIPDRASDDYVKQVFDELASDYERSLSNVNYSGPDLIRKAIESCDLPGAGLRILDAGCGTGLCGEVLRPRADRLVGVDLSQGMLAKARQLQLYDELVEAELIGFLQRHSTEFDLIVATDTFNYFGDLKELCSAVHAALRPGGRLVFTLEKGKHAGDFKLCEHGRYSHSPDYLRLTLSGSQLRMEASTEAILRTEDGQPVVGIVVVATGP